MKNLAQLIFLLILFSLAIAPRVGAAIQDPVRVEQGQLSGTDGINPGVKVYRGVPYAAPPVGDLRWKPPQPAAKWTGVREAKDFSKVCMQEPSSQTLVNKALTPSQAVSEDCLYLNIWTPAKSPSEKLPVMVWIHGGGYTMSSGSLVGYDGEHLAGKGVIVVTINYRLGIFGFLALPELAAESSHHAAGNYTLMDIIAALQWVQKNIASFGGDPGKVTVFGQSVGSFTVNILTACPLAKGLFQRAIGESGANFSEALRAGSTGGNAADYPPMLTLADAEADGEKVVSKLGITGDRLKALRAEPAEKLAHTSGVRSWAAVDGWVMPQDVWTIYAEGKQNDVYTIEGNVAKEAASYIGGTERITKMTAAGFAAEAKQRYGDFAEQFLKAYPATSDAEAIASAYGSFRDERFGWDMRTWARMQTKTGHKPIYRYYFSHVPPGPQAEEFGAFHTSEIAYVYGNFNMYPFPYGDTDHRLSEMMMSYWTNFAKTGDPNGPGLPKWSAYDIADDNVMEFGDQPSMRTHVNQAGLDFFDAYHATLPAQPAWPGTK